MASIKLLRTLFHLKFRLIAHGPNAERGFGLIAGMALAGLIVGLAFFVAQGQIDGSWLLLALTIWGLFWPLAPLIQPTFSETLLRHDWLRTLPGNPWRQAVTLSITENVGVGPLVTMSAFVGLLVMRQPLSIIDILFIILAVVAQVYFFVWLGKITAAVVNNFMQLRFGRAIAAAQMSLLLALSFAGWIPIAALILPTLESGGSEIIHIDLASQLPVSITETLMSLPTGWGFTAVQAAHIGEYSLAAYLITSLVALTLLLWVMWVALTVKMLRKPPTRRISGFRAIRPFQSRPLQRVLPTPIYGTFLRELKTWMRDPVRSLEIRHAWLTPAIIAAIVVFSGWDWALPFIGIVAVLFGAMVAANTYALDGTAFWQLVATPGALRSDLIGRQLAWILLFGLPSIIATILLAVMTQSPLSLLAMSGVIVSTACACILSPLLAISMPAIGTDARSRLRLGERAGDPTGVQMTILPVILFGAVLPMVMVAAFNLSFVVALALSLTIALAMWRGIYILTLQLLRRRSIKFYASLRSE